MYAIIETGGKQFKVSEGDEIFAEKIAELEDKDEGAEITIDKVVFVGTDDGKSVIGSPYVSGASVTASLVKNGKSKKIVVFTYKPKKGTKKKQGHRQLYTKIKITKISL